MQKGNIKIEKNIVGGVPMYAVYRLFDANGTDHSGNREYLTGYYESRPTAEEALKHFEKEYGGKENVIK